MAVQKNVAVTLVLLTVIALGAILLALNEAHRNRVITSDSIIYVDTARHIAAGKGITTSILRLGDTQLEPAQTQWPPFYSFSMAPLIAVGVDPIFAGRLISAISFGLIVLLCGIWIWRKFDALTGVAATALLTTLPPLTGAAAAVWADLLYTLIVLIIVGLGISLLHQPSRKNWFVFGALIGIAIFTKYLGIILIGVAALFLLLELRGRKNLSQTAVHGLMAIVGIALFVIPLLFRNILLDRPIGGAERYLSDQSLGAIFSDTIVTLWKNFTETWVWMLTIIVAVASFVIVSTAKQKDTRIRTTVHTLAAVIGVYIIGLMITRWLIDTDPIHTRFLVPLYPLIVVIPILLMSALATAINQKTKIAVLMTVTLISLGWTVKAYDFNIGKFEIPETSRIAWIRENTTNRDLLIGDHGPEYTLFLGRTSIYLEANPNAEKLTEEYLTELRERWSNRTDRILITASPSLDSEYGSFVAALSRKENIPTILSLIHEESKLLVFSLK